MNRFPALLLGALLVAVPACATTTTVHSDWTTRSAYGLRNTTRIDELELTCRDGRAPTEISFVCDGDEGAARLSVIDPHGASRWAGSAARGHCEHEVSFAPVPGVWILRVDLREFTGGYRAALVSSSLPRVQIEWLHDDS